MLRFGGGRLDRLGGWRSFRSGRDYPDFRRAACLRRRRRVWPALPAGFASARVFAESGGPSVSGSVAALVLALGGSLTPSATDFGPCREGLLSRTMRDCKNP